MTGDVNFLEEDENGSMGITIQSKETGLYLCFNQHWKIVGMRRPHRRCYFEEKHFRGHYEYRSKEDQGKRLGFTHSGRAIGPKFRNKDQGCYAFDKIISKKYFNQPESSSSSITSSGGATSMSETGHQNNRHRNGQSINKQRNGQNRNLRRNNNNTNSNINNRRKLHRQETDELNLNTNNNNSKNVNNNKPNNNLNNNNGSGKRLLDQNHHHVRHHHNDPTNIQSRKVHEQEHRRKRLRTTTPIITTTTSTPTITPRIISIKHNKNHKNHRLHSTGGRNNSNIGSTSLQKQLQQKQLNNYQQNTEQQAETKHLESRIIRILSRNKTISNNNHLSSDPINQIFRDPTQESKTSAKLFLYDDINSNYNNNKNNFTNYNSNDNIQEDEYSNIDASPTLILPIMTDNLFNDIQNSRNSFILNSNNKLQQQQPQTKQNLDLRQLSNSISSTINPRSSRSSTSGSRSNSYLRIPNVNNNFNQPNNNNNNNNNNYNNNNNNNSYNNNNNNNYNNNNNNNYNNNNNNNNNFNSQTNKYYNRMHQQQFAASANANENGSPEISFGNKKLNDYNANSYQNDENLNNRNHHHYRKKKQIVL